MGPVRRRSWIRRLKLRHIAGTLSRDCKEPYRVIHETVNGRTHTHRGFMVNLPSPLRRCNSKRSICVILLAWSTRVLD
jgi:hypothetical protein